MKVHPFLVLFLAGTLGSFSPSRAATPAHFWSKATGNAVGQDVAADAAGNIYVTGAFSGTVDLGDGSLVSAGFRDVFLAKFRSNGELVWSQRFGGTSEDEAHGIAVDPRGNVIITGYFHSTIGFGQGLLHSAGQQDIFVAKFRGNRILAWNKKFGSTSIDIGEDVAVSPSGAVVITGYFTNAVDFGGGSFNGVGWDIYLAQYDSLGTHQWSKKFGSTNNDYGYKVATDGAGNVIATGAFAGTVNFGGANLVCPGELAMYVAKYTSAGTYVWSRGAGPGGSVGDAVGYGLATDPAGNVIVSGTFNDPANFGGGLIGSIDTNFDIFLVKYAAAGGYQWGKALGGIYRDDLNGIATDGSGNILLVGEFFGPADFGGGTLNVSGSSDIVMAKYDPDGNHVWSRRAGGGSAIQWSTEEYGLGVTADPSGNAIFSGKFYQSANFGGDDVSAISPILFAGFLAKYGPRMAEPAITGINDVPADQGHHVTVSFSSSGHEAPGDPKPVIAYRVLRRDGNSTWTQVASLPASQLPAYDIDAITLTDSTITSGQHFTSFIVEAILSDSISTFASAPDSGWSVDNVPPPAPTGLGISSGVLSWLAAAAPDVDHYTIFGSEAAAFDLSAVIVTTVTATEADVSGTPYTYYYVRAIDQSGNEGPAAGINVLSGVEAPHFAFALSAYPNPFNPNTTITCSLPQRGHMRLTIYDARGERVITLVNGIERAGAHQFAWDGRSASGTAVSSSVYFAKLEFRDRVKMTKLVLLK